MNYSNTGPWQQASYCVENTASVLAYIVDWKWLKKISANIVLRTCFIVSHMKNRPAPGGTLPRLSHSSILPCLFSRNTGSRRITRALTSSLYQHPPVSVSSYQPAAPLWFTQQAHSGKKQTIKAFSKASEALFQCWVLNVEKKYREAANEHRQDGLEKVDSVAIQPSD